MPACPAADHYSLFETGAGAGAGTIELSVTVPSSVVNGAWSSSTGGVWSDSTKWSGGNVPGGNAQDAAVYGPVLTSGTAVVTLDSSRSLSSLGFNTPAGASYVIIAVNGSTLTMSNTIRRSDDQ